MGGAEAMREAAASIPREHAKTIRLVRKYRADALDLNGIIAGEFDRLVVLIEALPLPAGDTLSTSPGIPRDLSTGGEPKDSAGSTIEEFLAVVEHMADNPNVDTVAPVAQRSEPPSHKGLVGGSTPPGSTIFPLPEPPPGE